MLVLTTTANAEDILLVIRMDNAEKRGRGEKQHLVAEDEGALDEMKALQSESTENIASLEYSEASLEVIENDSESHHYQVDENVAIESSSEQTEDIVPSDEDGLENISLTFKLSLNCNNGNVC